MKQRLTDSRRARTQTTNTTTTIRWIEKLLQTPTKISPEIYSVEYYWPLTLLILENTLMRRYSIRQWTGLIDVMN